MLSMRFKPNPDAIRTFKTEPLPRVRRSTCPLYVGPGSLGWRGAVPCARNLEPTAAHRAGGYRAATSRPPDLSKAGDGVGAEDSMKRKTSRGHRKDERDTMRPEYDFSAAVRGLTAARYAQGANIVVVDPEVLDVFPDGAAGNEALRALAPVLRHRPNTRQNEEAPNKASRPARQKTRRS